MAGVGWKSSDEAWPDHSRPRARAALHKARKSGWWLKKANATAHIWGIITCGDPSLPRDERCTTNVLSTSGPADGSETAEVINRRVNCCTHERETAAETEALAAAEELVMNASLCLKAARSLVKSDGHRHLVEDYLAQAEENAEEAERLLAQAIAQDELKTKATAAASESAAAGGTSIDPGPTQLAERASSQALEAEDLIDGDTSREARVLRGKCDDIRTNARAFVRALGEQHF